MKTTMWARRLPIAAAWFGLMAAASPAASAVTADPAACIQEAPRQTFDYWPPGTSVMPGRPAPKVLRVKYPRHVQVPTTDAERAALHDIFWPNDMSARFTLRHWLMAERFECLEEAFADLQATRARYPDGDAKVISFLTTMPDLVDAQNGMTEGEIDALIQRWRAAQPASLLPDLLWPRLLNAAAWNVRGGDYANKVPPDAMREFKRLNAKAIERSKEAPVQAQAHLLWHYVALRVLGTGEANTRQLDALTVAALKRFPDDLSLALSAGTSHLPEWGGSEQQFDTYAETIRKVVGGARGEVAYAMLYTRLVRLPAMLNHQAVRMDVVRRGLLTLAQDRGAEPISMLQSFACATRDEASFRQAQQLWAEYAKEPQIGPPATDVDSRCRAWLQSLPPS